MVDTIAVVAPGAMGAGVGARLADHGIRVVTSTAGRSPATLARAKSARMEPASDGELARAGLFLSIVPPSQAVALATRMAGPLRAAGRPVIYADCNAVSPATAETIREIVTGAGAVFVDGGIVGGPPQAGSVGPTFYLSGPAEETAAILARHGITVRVLDGGVGAASALKMAYAGLNKGLTALGAAMILAATRAGVDRALLAELQESQPELLARLSRAIPAMLPKAHRWGPEMNEIADFVGTDRPESDIWQAMAVFYTLIAGGAASEAPAAVALNQFFEAGPAVSTDRSGTGRR